MKKKILALLLACSMLATMLMPVAAFEEPDEGASETSNVQTGDGDAGSGEAGEDASDESDDAEDADEDLDTSEEPDTDDEDSDEEPGGDSDDGGEDEIEDEDDNSAANPDDSEDADEDADASEEEANEEAGEEDEDLLLEVNLDLLDIAPDGATQVTTWSELRSALSKGGDISIMNDIDAVSSASLYVKGVTSTVYGNGYTLNADGKQMFVLGENGTLHVNDLVMVGANRTGKKTSSAYYAYKGKSATFTNCVVYSSTDTYGKQAVLYGGSVPLNLINCTVVNNTYGVYLGSTSNVIANNIIVGNGSGNDITFSSTTSSSTIDGGYNLVGKVNNSNFGSGEETVIDADLADYSSWMTTKGMLLEVDDSPARGLIPVDNTYLPERDINNIQRGEITGLSAAGAYELEFEEDDSLVLQRIEITNPPSVTNYVEGQYFSKTGMEVKAYYKNPETDEETDKTIRSYEYEPSGKLEVTDTMITVTYKDLTATTSIAVQEKEKIDSVAALELAISEASAGATITLTGNINLQASKAITINKNITIDGDGYTVDGGGAYYLQFTQTSGTFTLRNLKVLNTTGSEAVVYDNTKSSSHTMNIENCVFINNSATYGAVYAYFNGEKSKVTLKNNTIVGNRSTSSSAGGGFTYYYKATVSVAGNIIAGNTGGASGDIYTAKSDSSYSVSGGYNIIGSAASYVRWASSAAGNLIGTGYNNYSAWLNAETGELIYTSEEHADNPAVDAIPASWSSNVTATDIVGTQKPQGRGYDIGAYEALAIHAETPVFERNLSEEDVQTYLFGETTVADPIYVEMKDISDGGALRYEWYSIDDIKPVDGVTEATRKIEGATESSYTPDISSLGTTHYFVIVYNKNEAEYINGDTEVYDVSVKQTVIMSMPAGMTADRLEIETPPDDTEYVEGQLFQPAGMELYIVYKDADGKETKVRVADGNYTYEPAGALTTDMTKVTISYEGLTVDQEITVIDRVVDSLEVTKEPTKLKYNVGDLFKTDGMEITAHFNDNSTEVVPAGAYTYEPAGAFTIADPQVTAEYQEVIISYAGKSATLEVMVARGVVSIEELQAEINAAETGDTIYIAHDLAYEGSTTTFAVAVSSKTITIDGMGNAVDMGSSGGLFNITSGTVTLEDMTIRNAQRANSSNLAYGGAIAAASSANLTIDKVIFENNKYTGTSGGGGAIGINNAKVNIKNSVFRGNTSAYQGGAVQITSSGGTVEIENSIFTENQAVYGGAIAAIGSSSSSTIALVVRNSTIVGNVGTNTTQGAIYQSGSYASVGLANSVVTGNYNMLGSSKVYADLYIASTANFYNLGYNVVSNTVFSSNESANAMTGNNSVYGADYAAYSAYLSESFVPRAVANSPVLDKIPAGNEYMPTVDIAGNARPYNSLGDIGAYEYSAFAITASAGTGGSISPSGEVFVEAGGSKTFTITPDTGYEISAVRVDGVSKGAIASYMFTGVTQNHTIAASFTKIDDGSGNGSDNGSGGSSGGGSGGGGGGGSGSSDSSSNSSDETGSDVTSGEDAGTGSGSNGGGQSVSQMADVSSSDWYYTAVSTVVESGLFTGTSDGSFAPDQTMTRAMFATVLGRLAESMEVTVSGENTFGDVPSGQWYSDYIAWAGENGIITGLDENTFGLEENITREQMAVILVRFLEFMEIDLSGLEKASFADDGAVSDWAGDAVGIAAALGLISGYPDGSFGPANTASRAEVAQIMTNFLNLYSA